MIKKDKKKILSENQFITERFFSYIDEIIKN